MGISKYTIPQPWRRKYAMVKAQAKHRGEEWAFDDVTWLKIWEDSGVKEHMGRHVHSYCMVRIDPVEAWAPYNVMVVTRRLHMKKNSHDYMHRNGETDWQLRHGVYVPPEAQEKHGE